MAGDLVGPNRPDRLVAEAVATYGRVDVLVNNIGAARPPRGGLLGITDAKWQWSLDINFMAAVRRHGRRCRTCSNGAPSTIATVVLVKLSSRTRD